jgi:uncharacterized protein
MSLLADHIQLGDERFSHNQIASILSPKMQQLIILPTEKCNFRCTYCYEDFLIGKMKEPVQLALERFMTRRIPELSHMSISWFGGEPLLAKKVVLRLSAFASRLCKEHDVALHGGMTTNAYLLNFELFEELLSYDQRFFQITLDGWEGEHDVLRRRADGGGTFDRIWGNLLATRASAEAFDIQIRIHVRRDNHASLETLVDNIAQSFGGDPRYTLDFEHLRNLGGEGGKSVERPMSLAELRDIEPILRARYDGAVAALPGRARAPAPAPAPEQGQVQVFSSSMGEVSGGNGGDPYICYAAKPNSLLIRADGRIGKCTVALNDDRNTIGRINEDGTVSVDNALLRPWLRGLSNLDPGALQCPLGGMAQMASAEG